MQGETMDRTRQYESDTAVEEREILLQRAGQAITAGDAAKITIARNELREYREQYLGDPALAAVDDQLRKLDAALGEKSPDVYAYAENDPQ